MGWRTLALAAALLPGSAVISACSGDDADPEAVPVLAVEVGECFQAQTEPREVISELRRTDCGDPHAHEAYAVVEYTPPDGAEADTYPGDRALDTFAEGACAGEFGEYVGVDYLDSDLFFTYLAPSARSWDQDDHDVLCFVTRADQPLTGSVRGIAQ